MRPLSWLRPTIPVNKEVPPSGEQILPSFVELQSRTWETLYPQRQQQTELGTDAAPSKLFQDKSPKGSVDAPIQCLVDLINHHSAICTLSSCSGRISLFDPNERQRRRTTSETSDFDVSIERENDRLDPSHTNQFTESSGKGRGTWVVVSHELLDPDEAVHAIFSRPPASNEEGSCDVISQPWILKFEPMLLHVAARSLAVGQALLQLALECGFRESGLVVTPKRVTVAIRSHSLALGIPLLPTNINSTNNGLCPSTDYIRSVKMWHFFHRC